MGLDSAVSLLVASLDLKMVQSVVNAMRMADLAGAKTAPGQIAAPDAVFEPRRHIEPTPVYEPRRHIHPEPMVDTGPVLAPIERPKDPLYCTTAPEPLPVAPTCSKSPIEPPWKVLPWKNPLPPRPKVKFVHRHADTARRGVFVNVFA